MSNASSPVRTTFASVNALLAMGLLIGVFGALPVRYWVVDVVSSVIAAALLISAYGLLARSAWSLRVLRYSAVCELTVGLAAIAALVLGIVYLGGVHGTAGRTAITIAIAGSALLAPYLVVYPVVQLLWVHRNARSAPHA